MLIRKQNPLTGEIRPGPKYHSVLRPIGAYLDTLFASHLVLAEIEHGFFWRCLRRDDPGHLLFGLISRDEVHELEETMKRSRSAHHTDADEAALGPDVDAWGYEELLRTLSHELDKHAATTVVIVEDSDAVLVQYSIPVAPFVHLDLTESVAAHYFHEDIYTREEIGALIAAMRGRRAKQVLR
jgi:hypothetical protein